MILLRLAIFFEYGALGDFGQLAYSADSIDCWIVFAILLSSDAKLLVVASWIARCAIVVLR